MPNEARMIDYILGGKDNFAADRAAAERALAVAPELPIMARESRHFLHRAVRFMVEEGIRQFVDVGCGLPTRGSVHEAARATAPDARVVYIDDDPLVVNHAQALLAGAAGVAVIRGDMRAPGELLAHPGLTELIDLRRPVGILFVGVLTLISDDEVALGVVEGFRQGVVSGSHLAITHPIADTRPEVTEKLAEIYHEEQVVRGSRRRNVRTRAEVELFFEGLEVVEPGIVKVPAWRPDSGVPAVDPEMIWAIAGVGRKP